MESDAVMPKELEASLRKRARKLFPNDKNRQDRYVYGTMRNMGWQPNSSRRAR